MEGLVLQAPCFNLSYILLLSPLLHYPLYLSHPLLGRIWHIWPQIRFKECLSSAHPWSLRGLNVLLPFIDYFSETSELSPFLLLPAFSPWVSNGSTHDKNLTRDEQILQQNPETFSQLLSFQWHCGMQLNPTFEMCKTDVWFVLTNYLLEQQVLAWEAGRDRKSVV